MPADFAAILAALKPILVKHAKKLTVDTDSETNYSLSAKSPSPFPQHKGKPMWFGGIRVGKSYVSFYLMPLYTGKMDISAELKKRMQGKSCFNFKTVPEAALVRELKALTASGLKQYAERKWL